MKNNKGFTLIELMITLTVFTIMLSYASVSFISKRQTQGIEKLVQEISMIQAAAKKYYMDQYTSSNVGNFPTNLATLQTAQYLGTNFPTNNPFGNPYTCSRTVSGTNQFYTITTLVPNQGLARSAASVLPNTVVTNSGTSYYVTSTLTIPGNAPMLENLLHRDAASTDEQRTMRGNIIFADGVALVDLDSLNNPTGFQVDPNGNNIVNDLQAGGTGNSGVMYVSATNKRVGINTGGLTNAQEALHVVGNLKINKSGDTSLNDEYFKTTVTSTDTKLETDRSKMYLGSNTNNILTIDNTNTRVGINNTSPTYSLDVVGNGIKWGAANTTSSKGLLSTDQGSSIELGGSGIPYIDFANSTSDDYDVRVQLTGDDEISIDGGQLNLKYNRTRISGFDGSGNHWVRYNQTDDNDLIMGIHRNGQNDYDLHLKGGHRYATSGANITFGQAANGTTLNLKKGLVMQQSVVRSGQTVPKPVCPTGTNPYIFVSPASINTGGYPITGVSAYASNSSTYWTVTVTAYYWDGNSTNNSTSSNNTAIVQTRCF